MATVNLSEMEMDELSRRVADFLANDPKYIRNKRLCQCKDSRSLSAKFAEEVPLMGLNDAIKSKNRAAKFVWLIVFIACVGATSYFLFRVFDEYLTNPTATKVKMARQEHYSFPPLVLCVDTWLNAKKAFRLGLTQEAIDYGLSYLYATVKPWKEEYKTNLSQAQANFKKIFHQNNFTDLIHFFEYISLDAVYDYDPQKKSDDVEYTCSGCESTAALPKIIFDQNMCYKLILSKIDGKERQSYGFGEFFLRVPDLSLNFAKRKSYWRLYVNPLMTKLIPSVPFLSIEKGHTHMVRITSARYRVINKPTEPCVEANDAKRVNYSALACTADCLANMIYESLGCRIFNLESNHRLPLHEYCNAHELSKRKPADHDLEETKKIASEKEKCLDSCIAGCNVWKYDTMIDAHPSTQLHHAAISENFSEKNMTAAKIYFTNADVLADGMVYFREVYTYSFETLIGNIGGTCGIWIGVNILTLMQLFSFCSKYCVRPKARQLTIKKRKKKNLTKEEPARGLEPC